MCTASTIHPLARNTQVLTAEPPSVIYTAEEYLHEQPQLERALELGDNNLRVPEFA